MAATLYGLGVEYGTLSSNEIGRARTICSLPTSCSGQIGRPIAQGIVKAGGCRRLREVRARAEGWLPVMVWWVGVGADHGGRAEPMATHSKTRTAVKRLRRLARRRREAELRKARSQNGTESGSAHPGASLTPTDPGREPVSVPRDLVIGPERGGEAP